jgi:molybdenum cofactor synthesis domain-containing protein
MFSAGILTISDKGSRGERQDKSGEAIREILSSMDVCIVNYDIIPDEKELIVEKLVKWADEGDLDVVITTGGTGLTPRDVTPEATLSVVDRIVPGFAEAMRAESLKKTPRAMLSRAVVGTRGKCLIINLPGSPKAVRECPMLWKRLKAKQASAAHPKLKFKIAEKLPSNLLIVVLCL